MLWYVDSPMNNDIKKCIILNCKKVKKNSHIRIHLWSGYGFYSLDTYLFTCVVIPHGSDRASQGTSAPGCTSLASDGYAHIPLGAVHLVCSQLFVWLPKCLAFFHTLTGILFQLSITRMLKNCRLISSLSCLTRKHCL